MIEIIYGLILTNAVTLATLIYIYKKRQHRPESIELQEFLMDLLTGNGLIQVRRIAPSDIVVRARRR